MFNSGPLLMVHTRLHEDLDVPLVMAREMICSSIFSFSSSIGLHGSMLLFLAFLCVV